MLGCGEGWREEPRKSRVLVEALGETFSESTSQMSTSDGQLAQQQQPHPPTMLRREM